MCVQVSTSYVLMYYVLPLSLDMKDAFVDPYIIRELSRCTRVPVCNRVYIEFGTVSPCDFTTGFRLSLGKTYAVCSGFSLKKTYTASSRFSANLSGHLPTLRTDWFYSTGSEVHFMKIFSWILLSMP
jgi:hypothetical protein